MQRLGWRTSFVTFVPWLDQACGAKGCVSRQVGENPRHSALPQPSSWPAHLSNAHGAQQDMHPKCLTVINRLWPGKATGSQTAALEQHEWQSPQSSSICCSRVKQMQPSPLHGNLRGLRSSVRGLPIPQQLASLEPKSLVTSPRPAMGGKLRPSHSVAQPP